jgi:hypothetical protein
MHVEVVSRVETHAPEIVPDEGGNHRSSEAINTSRQSELGSGDRTFRGCSAAEARRCPVGRDGSSWLVFRGKKRPSEIFSSNQTQSDAIT